MIATGALLDQPMTQEGEAGGQGWGVAWSTLACLDPSTPRWGRGGDGKGALHIPCFPGPQVCGARVVRWRKCPLTTHVGWRLTNVGWRLKNVGWGLANEYIHMLAFQYKYIYIYGKQN